MKLSYPDALQRGHNNLRAALAAAKAEQGALGEAARLLARDLEPHFDVEEHSVFPALGLLPALVEGRLDENMAAVLVRTQQLKQDLPRMLDGHRRIREGLERLRAAAAAASRPAYERFADSIIEHMELEEEVLYLAAIMVCDHVALMLGHERSKAATKSVPPWRTRLI
ncbi:MAG: hemerythrin domain-containing protein [Burkholderiales bacterium]|nr:hemerythrin domain-containing protein [Burkholderiales bacterium]